MAIFLSEFAENGSRAISQDISPPVVLQPNKGYFGHRLLAWPVGLSTSMAQDMSGFHDPHCSELYLEFQNAESFE